MSQLAIEPRAQSTERMESSLLDGVRAGRRARPRGRAQSTERMESSLLDGVRAGRRARPRGRAQSKPATKGPARPH